MGWSYRKSVNLGPVRLNFSKSGVGLSGGVRGARVGFDAKGRAYVHCGFGGVSYRSNLGEHGTGVRPPPAIHPAPRIHPSPQVTSGGPTAGPQQTIDSGDTAAMIPSTAADLLAEIQRRRRLFPLHILYAVLLCVGAAALVAAGYGAAAIACLVFAVGGTIGLAIWMRQRRTLEIAYQLDTELERRFAALLSAFEYVRASHGFWLIDSHAAVYQRKYHAGANQLVERAAVHPRHSPPPYIKTNLKVPMIPAGRQTLYFLPDRILVYEGSKIGAVEYADLQLRSGRTNFVEATFRPADARCVGETWMFVNKSGGPDRRFRNNRAMAVMEYAEFGLQSRSGLNELFQISNTVAADKLASALSDLVTDWTSARSHSA